MSLGALLLLRLIHVVLGVFWVGAVIFVTLFLLPSLQATGPAGGAVMQQLAQVRRLPLWLMGATTLTVLSGIGLYWHDSLGFTSSTWLASGPGRTFGLGGALAITAAVVGMAVNSPTAKRLGAVAGRIQASGRAPSPEDAADIQRLQGRLVKASLVVTGLVVLATTAMAVARYM
jgi:uncharacterized membrane protein